MSQQKQKKQGGGRKEAPLAGVGSGLVAEQPKKILTPEDAEYKRYSELLEGFFEKLLRWQEILKTDEYKKDEKTRRFKVLSSPNGSYIVPGFFPHQTVY